MIPDQIKNLALDSVLILMGERLVFETKKERKILRGLFENNPLAVDMEGNQVIGNDPRLVLKNIDSEGINLGDLVTVKDKKFRIQTRQQDATRGTTTFELEKTRD